MRPAAFKRKGRAAWLILPAARGARSVPRQDSNGTGVPAPILPVARAPRSGAPGAG